jgi:RPA family protein
MDIFPAEPFGTTGQMSLVVQQSRDHHQLLAYRDSLNRAKIAREIAELQTRLLVLAKEKTEQPYLASIPTALPDVRKGIRVKAS